MVNLGPSEKDNGEQSKQVAKKRMMVTLGPSEKDNGRQSEKVPARQYPGRTPGKLEPRGLYKNIDFEPGGEICHNENLGSGRERQL